MFKQNYSTASIKTNPHSYIPVLICLLVKVLCFNSDVHANNITVLCHAYHNKGTAASQVCGVYLYYMHS